MKLSTPFAGLLPPLSTEEFEALKASIKADGVREPVVTDEDDNILDGHNRYKIDKNAPTRKVKGLTPAEKEAFAFQANFMRRNLSATQKRESLARMKKVAAKLREEDPKKNTQKRVAMLLGVTQQCVAKWFSSSKENGTNTTSCNTSAPPPDARVKVNPTHKAVIAKRVAEGETSAQVAADYGVTDRHVRTIVKQETKAAEVKATREKASAKRKTDNGIICGDFRQLGLGIEDGSIDMIMTDPPYDAEAAGLYQDIATLAAGKLAKGGWVLAYSGQAHLPAVLKAFAETASLEYGWTFCILHSGGDLRFRKYKLHNSWKPVVAAYKPPLAVDWDWFKDVVSGGKEKEEHPWQQAVAESAYFIERFCPKGGLVFDPCCGSATTLLAAKTLKRKWLGYEKDNATAEAARQRLDGQ